VTDIRGVPVELPTGVIQSLSAHLGRQRWYAGSAEPGPAQVQVRSARELWSGRDGAVRLLWAVVDAEQVPYQLLIGERPHGEPAEFLNGHDEAALATAGSAYFYDATLDPELALVLLPLMTGDAEQAARVRPVSAEQSNTSLIYDDRIIIKIFRRLIDGPNPDIEVAHALSDAGFAQVPTPVSAWRGDGWDLAFAQEFLAGGSEGWALALTSLRDLYNSGLGDPADAGGDFAAEAARLGRMTADMHLALAAAFGRTPPPSAGPGSFAALIDDVARRLRSAAGDLGAERMAAAARLVQRWRAVPDPGPAIRVHGDYHLGQVMRTDSGWFVLDFEGEPARSRVERLRPTSPLKDTAAMLRSLHYAARFALTEWDDAARAALEALGAAWEERNRAAFIAGYLAVSGIEELLPGPAHVQAVRQAWEMDKALYELDYERAYRPEWTAIPVDAITRMLASSSDG
jgi:maltokinase